MPSPEQIRKQMEILTSELVGLSLCNHQNFPSVKDVGDGIKEVGVGGKGNLSVALKNVPYSDIYTELERTQTYNIKMLDGALIHMMYRFDSDDVIAHRLAFSPSPHLEEFQNNPEIYLEDEIYAEVVKKNIVPFPIRFDYDARINVAQAIEHPISHLTLGQYQNCRIPVSAALTPFYFIDFVLRNFYHTAFNKYSDELTQFSDIFHETISPTERKIVHVQIPTSLLARS